MSNLYDPYGHCLGHVNNFYYKLGETGVTFELDNEKTFRFNPGISCVIGRAIGGFGNLKNQSLILFATQPGLTV